MAQRTTAALNTAPVASTHENTVSAAVDGTDGRTNTGIAKRNGQDVAQAAFPRERARLPARYDDVNPAISGGFSGPTTTVLDSEAFVGSFVTLDDPSASFAYSVRDPSYGCDFFALIGPGDGDWTMEFANEGDQSVSISVAQIPDGPRETLYQTTVCHTFYDFTVTLVSGSGLGIDAVYD